MKLKKKDMLGHNQLFVRNHLDKAVATIEGYIMKLKICGVKWAQLLITIKIPGLLYRLSEFGIVHF